MCVCHVHGGLHRGQLRGSRSPGPEVKGHCELLEVDVGNQTVNEQNLLLTSESFNPMDSLQEICKEQNAPKSLDSGDIS